MSKENDKKEPSVADKLLGIINDASVEQLDALDAEIIKTEQRLAALTKVRKVVAMALGKVEKKKYTKKEPKTPAEKGDALAERRRRIIMALADGSLTGHAIMMRCGVAGMQLNETMNHVWFVKNGDTYSLSSEGRRAV